jgi:hypothetical protein
MCNLKVNAAKLSFTVGELEYLGYYTITREGIIPDPKNIQAILLNLLERPKCDVHHLITGLVQYYRSLRETSAHTLSLF